VRLVDRALSEQLVVLTNEARRINDLSAQGKALALAECLTKIEAAARDAQWRLLKMADERGIEP
jgi:hypothetical protein